MNAWRTYGAAVLLATTAASPAAQVTKTNTFDITWTAAAIVALEDGK